MNKGTRVTFQCMALQQHTTTAHDQLVPRDPGMGS